MIDSDVLYLPSMPVSAPQILALDFDGVLCDGLREYFQAAWRTYCHIWQPANLTPPPDLEPVFYRLRPVIENGWEMPVLICALLRGVSESEIFQNWPVIAEAILQQDNFKSADIGAKLDGFRDHWIATDLNDWLSYHRFYPGVVDRLRQILAGSIKTVIITTKEGRFVRQLLQQQNIDFPDDCIFGKELKRPKSSTLRQLLSLHSPEDSSVSIWFVEDRLKTLQVVQQHSDLNSVRLFLADWGYNTSAERLAATQEPLIHLLSLSQFAGDFSIWL